jgi:hypothetical protein
MGDKAYVGQRSAIKKAAPNARDLTLCERLSGSAVFWL